MPRISRIQPKNPCNVIAGRGEWVVVIQGTAPEVNLFCSEEIDQLARNYQVLNINYNVYGKKNLLDSDPYTIKWIVDNLRATMTKHDIRKAHLCSSGLGTFLAQGIQMYYPERVKSQVFVDYPGGIAGLEGHLRAEPVPALLVVDRYNEDSINAAENLKKCFHAPQLAYYSREDSTDLLINHLKYFYRKLQVEEIQTKLNEIISNY